MGGGGKGYHADFERLWKQKGCREDDPEWKRILYDKWLRARARETPTEVQTFEISDDEEGKPQKWEIEDMYKNMENLNTDAESDDETVELLKELRHRMEEADPDEIEDVYKNMEDLSTDAESDEEIVELVKELRHYMEHADPDEYIECDNETMELIQKLGIDVVWEETGSDMMIDHNKNKFNKKADDKTKKWADMEDSDLSDQNGTLEASLENNDQPGNGKKPPPLGQTQGGRQNKRKRKRKKNTGTMNNEPALE